ncbi:MAG TPA: metalloregulator ArsR/SmtB family transcription factor [Parvularculaceae bacterium]|nr:metalloregulator ArsR/SmtB family transcription factor [Parvularculaceae bacterium]HNS88216.1 metalloregulator ArsR/SmtB family transcription factor [Parvularculaceae bacterium]
MNPATDELDTVFAALAHETRRRILDLLRDRPGAGVGEVAAEFDVSRIAIMKHLQVLEEAHLIHSEKDGRVRRLYFNAAPIRMIYDRWTDDYSGYWAGEVTRLKYLAESRVAGAAQKTKQGKRTK